MDHASGLQTKLGCNSVGQFPLYQAAMNLMEEVLNVCVMLDVMLELGPSFSCGLLLFGIETH